jgi:hypothetical protein
LHVIKAARENERKSVVYAAGGMSLIHECQLKFSSKLTHARAGSQYNERTTKPINVFNSMLKTGKDCGARSYVLVCPEGF